jgi:RimJ/RimL family protein N-acetyltransferase
VVEGVIERSRDAWAIKKLATDPAIFPHICDDFSSNAEDWQPPLEEHVITLLGKDEQGYFGFGIFMPATYVCYQVHIGFLPRSYGGKALQSFKEMLDWMWAYTQARRIVGEVCSENRRAIRFAERAGFSFYGVNKKSRLRGGVLRDQVCLGISRDAASSG